MQPRDLHPKGPACAQRQPRKQARHVLLVEPVQRAPQAVVVEILRQDAGPQQVFDRFVREKLRHQIQLAVTEPQPIEHQRDRSRPHIHLLPIAGLLLVQPLGEPDLATDLRDDPQMVQMLHDIRRRHAAGSFHRFGYSPFRARRSP
jgi:hypothetical protein